MAKAKRKTSSVEWMNIRCPICNAEDGVHCRDLQAVPFSGSRANRKVAVDQRTRVEPHEARVIRANAQPASGLAKTGGE